ncbi:major facilitator superfamily member protein [Babesia ovata]|uniref:Major facilitator superfamily member protein n=1 Tax=Babesia ovata TaxID=189622 RepID=A0A2H6K9N7_9APIC|nr:major facilitator superfamily member protein [Babesia ovata]GBE59707.1 major facilitator superfamily member protein [Babesia ovata]
MRAFELTLGFSQSQLSTLATVSTMSRMGCCLIWGLLADKYKSNHVLAAGLLVMGMASIILSSASQYRSIVFLRFLHGFGFACVYPVQQKIVADSKETKKPEGAPGKPGSAGSSGSDGSTETNDSRESTDGKRYVWILFGISIVFGMEGQKCSSSNATQDVPQTGGGGENKPFYDLLADAANAVFTGATTCLLIFTLFIAEAPMCAFNYMTIYLQYLGVSDTMAGVAIAITLIGGAVGSAAGGKIIKIIGKSFDGYGELISGGVVMVVRIVVSLLFFLGEAPCGRLLWYHYIELATLGGTLVTIGGVDRELMKKAIKDEYQGTAAAMIRTISGIASSVILFQVSAYLTEKVFGYVPSRESFETMAAEVKERNAEALRKSMMYIILAGTLLNVVCYIALVFTFPGDRDKIKNGNGQAQ